MEEKLHLGEKIDGGRVAVFMRVRESDGIYKSGKREEKNYTFSQGL